jgi:hypothetical protein
MLPIGADQFRRAAGFADRYELGLRAGDAPCIWRFVRITVRCCARWIAGWLKPARHACSRAGAIIVVYRTAGKPRELAASYFPAQNPYHHITE